jgi:hypothetical protein
LPAGMTTYRAVARGYWITSREICMRVSCNTFEEPKVKMIFKKATDISF